MLKKYVYLGMSPDYRSHTPECLRAMVLKHLHFFFLPSSIWTKTVYKVTRIFMNRIETQASVVVILHIRKQRPQTKK